MIKYTYTVDDAVTFFATVPRSWTIQLYIAGTDKNIKLPYQKTVKEFIADELFKVLSRRECKTAVYDFDRQTVRLFIRKGTSKQTSLVQSALGAAK